MLNDTFGGAAHEYMFPTRAAVSGDDDDVAVQFFGRGGNLVPWDADSQSGVPNHTRGNPAGGWEGLQFFLETLDKARPVDNHRCERFGHREEWDRLEHMHQAKLRAGAFGEVLSKFQCTQRILRKSTATRMCWSFPGDLFARVPTRTSLFRLRGLAPFSLFKVFIAGMRLTWAAALDGKYLGAVRV